MKPLIPPLNFMISWIKILKKISTIKIKLKLDMKSTSQYGIQSYFFIRSLIYCDCNMRNFIVHKYFLSFH